MFRRIHIGYCLSLFLGFLLVFGIYVQYKMVPMVASQRKIGTSYMTMNNDFYKIVNAEIEKEVDGQGDILYTRDPALSVEKQCQQIESFIEKDVDLMIINPVDSGSQDIRKALEKARKKGIYIVVVDSQLKDDQVADVTIVSDNYQAGVLDARHMMATLPRADILLLEHADTLSAVDRIEGFLDTIAAHPQYRVVARRESKGQTEIAMPVVSAVIEEGIQFDVVMALNDQSAIGALAAIKEKALDRKTYIYGVDGSPDMKNLLQNTEDITATVAQSPVQMGAETIQSAYALLDGEAVEPLITIPVKLLDKTNIETVDVEGWQ
jgi:ribose transport system substrate-binding protein